MTEPRRCRGWGVSGAGLSPVSVLRGKEAPYDRSDCPNEAAERP